MARSRFAQSCIDDGHHTGGAGFDGFGGLVHAEILGAGVAHVGLHEAGSGGAMSAGSFDSCGGRFHRGLEWFGTETEGEIGRRNRTER